MRILLLSTLFAVTSLVIAACSGATSPPFSVPAGGNADAPRTAASPLEYVYVVNYNGNDISQYGLFPQLKPPMKAIGPNVTLPKSCKNPDSLVTIPHKALAFVSCFSGRIVALQITKNHTLSASKIKPVPIPSPLFLLAPRSGAPDVLYATEYPGAVAELHYGTTALKLQKTYATNSVYPNEMAFYSGGTKPELFVAAPYASMACGSASSSGGVLVYAQRKTGALTPEPPIPTCGAAFNVAIAGDNLYWAGANVFGAYSLKNNAPLPSPSPPWPANRGPSYYANAVSAIEAPRKPKADGPHGGFTYSGIMLGSDDGSGYVVAGSTGKTVDAFTLGTHLAIQAAECQYYAAAISMGGSRYQGLCFSAAKDKVELRGLPELLPHVRIVVLDTLAGNFPIAIHVSGPCTDYEYYYYYC